ncbi:MAG: 7-cyano-7-deazaguanine synthase [Sphingomonas sp.]|uniref:7-cyano-7-deazaguanine synthase n=1 Tax=Sphingomonas sp. TaxID=28214 RepID=UPI0025FE0E10|nr:7-cyano-7-deazaguanine synthase [Sphingomonas sp.]MBQ1500345.1 7-cyano-7-deazaguanine synthase [Sphingomonas sp.]MBQ8104235.1 7-cyano-7-deazaguanine synthase [Afipia sp.]
MKAVLLSGGMDSIALTFWQKPDFVITIDYGQRAASTELEVAAQVAHSLGIQHEVIHVDCSSLGSGDMSGRPASMHAPVSEWWPFRNQLLLTLGGMRSIAIGAKEMMLGSVASDESHADGRIEFFKLINGLMAMQEGAIHVTAPAIQMSTVELVQHSGAPRELIAWAHSCHTGTLACGGCRGCTKHYNVMKELYGEPY